MNVKCTILFSQYNGKNNAINFSRCHKIKMDEISGFESFRKYLIRNL